MSSQDGLVEWVREAMEPVGTVTSRRMMGGHTLYLDGVIFAIVAFDQIWFKGDADRDGAWDAAGCERFRYERAGGSATMNYRLAPEDAYDDPDSLRHWAALGRAAGQRAAARKKPKKKGR